VKTIGIDTNVLLTLRLHREPYFRKAKETFEKCLEGKIKIYLPLPALLEIEWVLRSFYKQPKEKITQFIDELLLIDNLLIDQKETLKFSLNLYKNNNIAFTDCVIISQIQNKNYDLLTFDQNLDKIFKSIN